MRKVIVIAVIGILGVIVPQTQASLVEIAIEAEVTDVSDDYNLLEGNVNVGDTIAGKYVYDSDTPASFPYQPSEAIYQHNSTPYGIFITVGGFNFYTDENNVDFTIGIENGISPSASDYYSIRSENNITLYNDTPVRYIMWHLADHSGQALSTTGLFNNAPQLDGWQDENLLVIAGGVEREETFGISARVTSTTLIPEPASLILISFGLICLKKRK